MREQTNGFGRIVDFPVVAGTTVEDIEQIAGEAVMPDGVTLSNVVAEELEGGTGEEEREEGGGFAVNARFEIDLSVVPDSDVAVNAAITAASNKIHEQLVQAARRSPR